MFKKIILLTVLLWTQLSSISTSRDNNAFIEFICIEEEKTWNFLERKFDNIERKFEQFEKTIDNIEKKFEQFEILHSISQNDERMVTHFDRLNAVERKLEDIKVMENKLNTIERKFESTALLGKEILERIENKLENIEENNKRLESLEASCDDIKTIKKEIGDKLGSFNSLCTKTPTNCIGATALTQASGIFNIQVDKLDTEPFAVACDVNNEGHGWLVIQRRQDGSVDFYRNWDEYKRGFGNLNGEFWIGLDKLHALTNGSIPQELLIFIEDFENKKMHAKYDAFAIGDESDKYALNVLGKYSGNAGDSLSQHLGMKFTTKDKQNDLSTDENCAVTYQGAWWYYKCYFSNLNGKYFTKQHAITDGEGICWNRIRKNYSLKYVQMMIRPKVILI